MNRTNPGRPARRAVSRPVCADETNPALSVDRKLFGTSTIGPHPARQVPAVTPHDPPRSAVTCRSAIGRPIPNPLLEGGHFPRVPGGGPCHGAGHGPCPTQLPHHRRWRSDFTGVTGTHYGQSAGDVRRREHIHFDRWLPVGAGAGKVTCWPAPRQMIPARLCHPTQAIIAFSHLRLSCRAHPIGVTDDVS